MIRAYIRNQETEDKRLDELSLFDRSKQAKPLRAVPIQISSFAGGYWL